MVNLSYSNKQYQSNIIIQKIETTTMGLQTEQYPFTIKTAILSQVWSSNKYEEDVLSSLDANCDLHISSIFTEEEIMKEETATKNVEQRLLQINLDQCFIKSDEQFGRKIHQHLAIEINQIFFKQYFKYKEKLKILIGYCGYLGVPYIVIKFNLGISQNIALFLQEIEEQLYKSRMHVIFIVDLEVEKKAETKMQSKEVKGQSMVNKDANNNEEAEYYEQLWSAYVKFHRQLFKKLSIEMQLALVLPNNLPDNGGLIQRWFAEKINFVVLKTSTFLTNNKGYPILSNKHQSLVKKLIRLKSNIILQNQTKHILSLEQKTVYFKYLAFVYEKMTKTITKRQRQSLRLLDYMQNPLQPYADNLESQTYEVFEFDQPKYDEYEIALVDALEQQRFSKSSRIVVYYIGAGRGMILHSIFNACKKTKKKVFVYCIEKNPYPIQTLKKRIAKNKWSKFVEIVFTDIKSYKMPEKPDILVSELLGGFGDNELSPECLQWAQKSISCLDTLCIPQNYSSYIQPVSYSYVHNNFKNAIMKQSYYTTYFGWHWTCFQSEKIWTFHHPLPQIHQEAKHPQQQEIIQPANNQVVSDILERTSEVRFLANQSILVNGILGSFDCELFGKGYMSIIPEKKTMDMHSWFPLFFAFLEAELLLKQESIVIKMMRRSSKDRIWYEWQYTLVNKEGVIRKVSKWHNENGKAIAIYLQE